MLKKETTFVIGAGASFDLGFPLGDGLRDGISNLLAFEDPNNSVNFRDQPLARLLGERARREVGAARSAERLDAYHRAATIIRNGLDYARSIDSFLDGLRDEPDVEFLGKLAIATAILRAESASPLTPTRIHAANWPDIRAGRVAKIKASWHALLGQILYEGHTRETIAQVFENASFVIFNYDRCIEEFLTVSLMNRFAIDRTQALDAVRACRIVHPYGQVGAFFPGQEGYVPFGAGDDADLLSVAAGIKTFTESMEEEIGAEVKDSIARADTIVFMGFGWLPQNMELLTTNDPMTEAQRVFATTMGMPVGEIAIVRDQVERLLHRGPYSPAFHGPSYQSDFENDIQFVNDIGDCKALMTNCWLRLTSD